MYANYVPVNVTQVVYKFSASTQSVVTGTVTFNASAFFFTGD